jgi:hypothetical protein
MQEINWKCFSEAHIFEKTITAHFFENQTPETHY